MAPIAAHMWELGSPELMDPGNAHGKDLLLEGNPPKTGDVMRMPHLAKTFRVREAFSIDLCPYLRDSRPILV